MDHKPNTCYYKPNRKKPRYFTEADAARIFCQAKADTGATQSGFISKCKCWDRGPEEECEQLRSLAEAAAAILAGILISILLPESIVARALVAVAKMIPQRLLVNLGVTRAIAALPTAAAELSRVIEMLRIGSKVAGQVSPAP
jgi:hypothetical protein